MSFPAGLLGLEMASGLIYLFTAWRLARNSRGSFAPFVAALLLEFTAATATQLIRGLSEAPDRTDKSKPLVIWSRTLELLDRGGRGAAPEQHAECTPQMPVHYH